MDGSMLPETELLRESILMIMLGHWRFHHALVRILVLVPIYGVCLRICHRQPLALAMALVSVHLYPSP